MASSFWIQLTKLWLVSCFSKWQKHLSMGIDNLKNIEYHQIDPVKGPKNNIRERFYPKNISFTVCITLRALWVILGHLCVGMFKHILCVQGQCRSYSAVCVSITVSGGHRITWPCMPYALSFNSHTHAHTQTQTPMKSSDSQRSLWGSCIAHGELGEEEEEEV